MVVVTITDTDISTDDWTLWSNISRQLLPPITPLLSHGDIDKRIDAIYRPFDTVQK